MKSTRLIVLVALIISNTPTRAELVDFSWWDSRFATPGVLSDARGGYTREARLPDEADIREVTSDSSTKTTTDRASVLVLPKDSAVVGTDPFTARAQTDFGKNHAETHTFLTGYGQSEDRNFFDRRHHVMHAESIWADQWTFTGIGLGTAPITVAASFEASITGSPCTTGNCGQVGHPIFSSQGLNSYWYRLYASVRVFDLDIIDSLVKPDSDYFDDVPREVGAFEVFQQGSNIAADSFGPLEPYVDVPNSRLKPVSEAGSFSFVPVAGHRYAVAGRIHVQSRDGADVDAGHTLSLNHVVLSPGLVLNSVAVTNGAQIKIITGTRLSATRTSSGEVTLSFPSMAGFTYFVEFKEGLISNDWKPLGSRAGDDKLQKVIDSNGAETARFYRLRVE